MEKRKKELFVFPEEIKRLISMGWKRLGLTVDLAHIQSVMDHELFLSSLDKEWIIHTHLSDFTLNSTHVPLGHGSMDIDKALAVLSKYYQGNVILEGFVRGQAQKTVQGNVDYLRTHGWM